MDYFREEKDAKVLFGIGMFPKNSVVVGRCTERFYVDVGEICRRFGGGGHATAASARISGATGIEVQERLLGLLVSILQQDKLSLASLMNTPVVTLSSYVSFQASLIPAT